MLGKITSVSFGNGGYGCAMFGFTFTLSGSEDCVQDFKGTWNSEPDEHCKWTIESQNAHFLKVFNEVREMMKQAKVSEFYELEGVPVEMIIENGQLKSWRVLTEVL